MTTTLESEQNAQAINASKETLRKPPTGAVRVERRDSGAIIIRLGDSSERIISLTEERLRSLKQALEEVAKSPPRGLVIAASSPDMFTVGADISLIQNITDPAVGEAAAREGQAIFAILEKLPCRTVAAISGPCVGGGCELALACSHRIITDKKSSKIGLPEVKLGILPGFGGTQRLPRLVGLPKALDIIVAGKTLFPSQALHCGLVDEIVSWESLVRKAEDIAVGKNTPRRRGPSLFDKILTNTSIGRSFVAKKARQTVLRQTKGHYPAPPAALESVLHGLNHGLEEGYENEARELGRLIVTPESKGLVHVFFLTESAKSIGKSAKQAVEHIHAVVIGAGVMGAGIAGILAKNECSVILKDTEESALTRAVTQIKSFLGKLRYLSETERSFLLNRVETTTKNSPNTGNANIAIEAIVEVMDVKKKVLADIASQMPDDAIIATNTSSLSVSEMGAAIKNPARFIGMHFFNPVEKMPLVEIIQGKDTSDRAIATIAALTVKLGKFPIVVNDVPGFLVNRILVPYLNEAAFLLESGYAVEAIDKAATKFGMPMGPIRLLDEVGLDVAIHVGETMLAGYGERMASPAYVEKLVAAKRLGKKVGNGFYSYPEDKKPVVAHDLESILGVTLSHKTPTQEIEDRLIFNLINESIKCLDEGVAGSPGAEAAKQIDLGTVMGIGFPPFHGGLIRYADILGATQLLTKLEALEKSCGSRFRPAPGIVSRAAAGKSFYESL